MDGPCRLCLRNRALRRSHIFPEFLFRRIADSKNRAVELSISRGKSRILQTCDWEYLLCGDCEARLQEHEDYFAKIWYEFPSLPERPGPSVQLSDLDYRRFKLFHLTALWRAAVSTRPAFDTVTLGRHAEKLRRMLLAGDPGPAGRYPVSGVILLDDDGNVQHKVLEPYYQSRVAGHHFYYAHYAGCEWMVTVSSHPYRDLAPAHLTVDGRLLLTSHRLVDLPHFKEGFVRFLQNEAARIEEVPVNPAPPLPGLTGVTKGLK
jgi:hypothetical protein